GVHAAVLMGVDQALDRGAFEVRLRRRRAPEQLIPHVIAQFFSEPGVERHAETGLRPSIDLGGQQVGKRIPQNRLRAAPVELNESGSDAAYSVSAVSSSGQ